LPIWICPFGFHAATCIVEVMPCIWQTRPCVLHFEYYNFRPCWSHGGPSERKAHQCVEAINLDTLTNRNVRQHTSRKAMKKRIAARKMRKHGIRTSK